MATNTPDPARHAPSGLLPTDPFDIALRDLTGLPDGAHTLPGTVTEIDDYGHTSSYIIRTVRWANGNTVFIERTAPPARFVLPPKVTAAIARQAEAVSAILKRRQGKRLAAEAEGRRRGARRIHPRGAPQGARDPQAQRRRPPRAEGRPVMFLILACLVTAFIVPIVAAVRGHAYRGVYAAIALLALVVGVVCWFAPAAVPPVYDMAAWNAMPEAERRGSVFIAEYARTIGAVLFVGALGSVLGALLYRAPHVAR